MFHFGGPPCLVEDKYALYMFRKRGLQCSVEEGSSIFNWRGAGVQLTLKRPLYVQVILFCLGPSILKRALMFCWRGPSVFTWSGTQCSIEEGFVRNDIWETKEQGCSTRKTRPLFFGFNWVFRLFRFNGPDG